LHNSPLSTLDRRSLIQFCFPTSEPISGPLFFVFRFKLSDSKFYNAFCLLDQTSLPLRDLSANQPSCLCFISSFYHITIFCQLLKAVQSLLLTGISEAARFLEFIRSSPRPLVSVPELAALTTSPVTELSHISANATSRLPRRDLGRLIVGLLTDTPIIIVASNLSVLSTFSYGLLALINPLEWHHLFAPVLPMSCLESIHCPIPYIVGIHRHLIPLIAGAEIEGHLFVNLDDGSVTPSGIPELPEWAEQMIRETVEIPKIIVETVCGALGVQIASSSRITARRIVRAIDEEQPDLRSFGGLICQSRTMQSFFDALRKPVLPTVFAKLLADGSGGGGLTPIAIQQIEEFPVRKVRKIGIKVVAGGTSDECSGSSSSLGETGSDGAAV
jgi:hypothetical protein